MCYVYIIRQRVFYNHKAVILAGNLNFTCLQITHRMICAAMAAFHLACCAAKGQRQKLMANANPEDGDVCIYQLAKLRHSIFSRSGRIARPVCKEDTVRITRQYLVSRGCGRYKLNIASCINKTSQDILLAAKIYGDDIMRTYFLRRSRS